MKAKHSKLRNSGLIFEILIRKITSDTLSKGHSPAAGILKEFFTKNELSKEYKIYNQLTNVANTDKDILVSSIDDILNESKKINRKKLRQEKYNLVSTIKEHYELDEFFKSKIDNYKVYAAVYNLLESKNNESFNDPKFIISNKNTLLEYINRKDEPTQKSELIQEYSKESKEVRILAYKIMLEKFNDRFGSLHDEQKEVLREYINGVSETPKFKALLNTKLEAAKKYLSETVDKIPDTTVKIKINEAITLIKPISPRKQIKEDDMLNVLYYIGLKEEVQNIV